MKNKLFIIRYNVLASVTFIFFIYKLNFTHTFDKNIKLPPSRDFLKKKFALYECIGFAYSEL